MKTNPQQRNIWSLVLALSITVASAFGHTFTNDTALSPGDTTYDGLGIIVSNCTLTVNGLHPLASLLLTNGAVLISHEIKRCFPAVTQFRKGDFFMAATRTAAARSRWREASGV